jgi:hypothetical protein
VTEIGGELGADLGCALAEGHFDARLTQLSKASACDVVVGIAKPDDDAPHPGRYQRGGAGRSAAEVSTGFEGDVARRSWRARTGVTKCHDLGVGSSRGRRRTFADDLALCDDYTANPGIRRGSSAHAPGELDRAGHKARIDSPIIGHRGTSPELASRPSSVESLSAKQSECVGNHIGDRLEALERSSGRAGKVEDKGTFAGARHPTREPPKRVDGAHRLRETGGLPLEHGPCPLRRQVAGGEAGPTRRDHEAEKAMCSCPKDRRDALASIGHTLMARDLIATSEESLDKSLPRSILASAGHDSVRDGHDLGDKDHPTSRQEYCPRPAGTTPARPPSR